MNITITKKLHWSTWVFLAITILLLLGLYQGCRHSKNQLAENQEIKTAYDSITAKMRQDSIDHHNANEFLIARLEVAENGRISQELKVRETEGSMARLQADNRRLLAHRQDISLIDTPALLNACNDCFIALKATTDSIDNYKEQVNALTELYTYEMALQDTVLMKEKHAYDSLYKAAQGLGELVRRSAANNKPRNKIYMTGAVMTDLTRFGATGGFTLVTKGNKIWSPKVGVFNKELFYSLDFGMLLSLKR